MKILHVWDQASTASVIAKWQRKLGHSTVVITNKKHDKIHTTSYYGGFIIKNKYYFILKALQLAKKFDIIHLHDAWFLVHALRVLYPRKKIVMHYHGSLVRANIKPKWFRLDWEKLTNAIILATPDLIEYEYSKQPYYIPNPIDTELFKPIQIVENSKTLIALKHSQSKSRTLCDLIKNGFNVTLDCIDRDERIYFEDFVEKLKQYEYYADLPVINGKMIHANSVSGLQAMAMGIKTISWDYSVSDTLPEYHKPERVVKEIQKIYQSLYKNNKNE